MSKISILCFLSLLTTKTFSLTTKDIKKYTEEFHFLKAEIKKLPTKNEFPRTKPDENIKVSHTPWYFPESQNKSKYTDKIDIKLSGIKKNDTQELGDQINLDELEKKLKQ